MNQAAQAPVAGLNPPADAYLTKQQLARLLNVSPRTVDNLIARRALPFVRLGGKLIRFPKAAVDEHIQRHLTVNARGG